MRALYKGFGLGSSEHAQHDARAPPRHAHKPVQVGEDLHRWRLCLSNFDEDSPGGKDLNSDLKV